MLFQRENFFLKTVAFVTVICFSASSLPAYGFQTLPTSAFTSPKFSEEVRLNPKFELAIPEQFGKIQEISSGSGPVLIHIQTAHGNYAAQKSIEGILRHLHAEYGFKTLFLEGSPFKLRPELLRFFPKRMDLTKKAADELAKAAILKGPELFLIDTPDAKAYGIEKLSSYKRCLQAFREVLRAKEKSKNFLSALDEGITRLTAPYLNTELKEYLAEFEQYEAQRINLEDWMTHVTKRAKDVLKIDFSEPIFQADWPMLVRMTKLAEWRKKIDRTKLEKEKIKFLKAVVNENPVILSPTEQLAIREAKNLVNARSFGRPVQGSLRMTETGTAPAALPPHNDIINQLKQLLNPKLTHAFASKHDLDALMEQVVSFLPKDFNYSAYLNLNHYIGSLLLQNELKPDLLAKEIETLNEQIALAFTKNKTEKEILVILKNYRLLQKLFALELTPEELERISESHHLPVILSAHEPVEQAAKDLAHSVIPDRTARFYAQPDQESTVLDPRHFRRRTSSSSRKVLRARTRVLKHAGMTGVNNYLNFFPSQLVRRLLSINSSQRVRNQSFTHLEEIDSLFKKALEFYDLVKERDSEMLERIEERLKETGVTKAVIVTGGFHAQPFKKYFEEKNYNYVLIAPSLGSPTESNWQKEHENYVHLMLDSELKEPSRVILNDPKGLLRGVKDLANTRSFGRPVQGSLRMTKTEIASSPAAPRNDKPIQTFSSTHTLELTYASQSHVELRALNVNPNIFDRAIKNEIQKGLTDFAPNRQELRGAKPLDFGVRIGRNQPRPLQSGVTIHLAQLNFGQIQEMFFELVNQRTKIELQLNNGELTFTGRILKWSFNQSANQFDISLRDGNSTIEKSFSRLDHDPIIKVLDQTRRSELRNSDQTIIKFVDEQGAPISTQAMNNILNLLVGKKVRFTSSIPGRKSTVTDGILESYEFDGEWWQFKLKREGNPTIMISFTSERFAYDTIELLPEVETNPHSELRSETLQAETRTTDLELSQELHLPLTPEGDIRYGDDFTPLELDIDLWLVPHGFTDDNEHRVMSGSRSDPSLNSRGHDQAEKGAAKLWEIFGERLKKGEIIYFLTSPLRRPIETGEHFVRLAKRNDINISLIEEPGLREMDFGEEWTGQKLADLPTLPGAEFTAGEHPHLKASAKAPSGEDLLTYVAFQKETLERLGKKYHGHTVVAFTHAMQTTASKILLRTPEANSNPDFIEWFNLRKTLERGMPILLSSQSEAQTQGAQTVSSAVSLKGLPAHVQRIKRGLENILTRFERYFQEAKDHLSPKVVLIFQNEIGFRRAVIKAVEAQGEFSRFFEEATKSQPRGIELYWSIYDEEVWRGLLTRNSYLNKRHSQKPLSFSEQFAAVLADPTAREKLREVFARQDSVTDPARYVVEDRVLGNLLQKEGIQNPLMLDLGASNGATSNNLVEHVGGHIIAVDKDSKPAAPATALMLAKGITAPPQAPASDQVERRQADVTKTFYENLQGKLSVIRTAALFVFLNSDEHKKVVSDVFRYAKGSPHGLFYHATYSSHTKPTLLSQFIFHIKGPKSFDWDLVHAGYLFLYSGKDRSSLLSDNELYKHEMAISSKVIRIRSTLLNLAKAYGTPENIFDEKARLKKEIRERLIHELFASIEDSKLKEIWSAMVKDILLISPWTYEDEFLGDYYVREHVHARHELAWNFVPPKWDVENLLEDLWQVVRSQRSPSIANHPINSHRPEVRSKDASRAHDGTYVIDGFRYSENGVPLYADHGPSDRDADPRDGSYVIDGFRYSANGMPLYTDHSSKSSPGRRAEARSSSSVDVAESAIQKLGERALNPALISSERKMQIVKTLKPGKIIYLRSGNEYGRAIVLESFSDAVSPSLKLMMIEGPLGTDLRLLFGGSFGKLYKLTSKQVTASGFDLEPESVQSWLPINIGEQFQVKVNGSSVLATVIAAYAHEYRLISYTRLVASETSQYLGRGFNWSYEGMENGLANGEAIRLADTWQEAISKAKQLFDNRTITHLVRVNQTGFLSDTYKDRVKPILGTGGLISYNQASAWNGLAQNSAAAYETSAPLHLYQTTEQVNGQPVKTLVIVYQPRAEVRGESELKRNRFGVGLQRNFDRINQLNLGDWRKLPLIFAIPLTSLLLGAPKEIGFVYAIMALGCLFYFFWPQKITDENKGAIFSNTDRRNLLVAGEFNYWSGLGNFLAGLMFGLLFFVAPLLDNTIFITLMHILSILMTFPMISVGLNHGINGQNQIAQAIAEHSSQTQSRAEMRSESLVNNALPPRAETRSSQQRRSLDSDTTAVAIRILKNRKNHPSPDGLNDRIKAANTLQRGQIVVLHSGDEYRRAVVLEPFNRKQSDSKLIFLEIEGPSSINDPRLSFNGNYGQKHVLDIRSINQPGSFDFEPEPVQTELSANIGIGKQFLVQRDNQLVHTTVFSNYNGFYWCMDQLVQINPDGSVKYEGDRVARPHQDMQNGLEEGKIIRLAATWPEAISKAKQLFDNKTITHLVRVSQTGFFSDTYKDRVKPILGTGGLISYNQASAWNGLAQNSAAAYETSAPLHLYQTTEQVGGQPVKTLVIVYQPRAEVRETKEPPSAQNLLDGINRWLWVSFYALTSGTVTGFFSAFNLAKLSASGPAASSHLFVPYTLGMGIVTWLLSIIGFGSTVFGYKMFCNLYDNFIFPQWRALKSDVLKVIIYDAMYTINGAIYLSLFFMVCSTPLLITPILYFMGITYFNVMTVAQIGTVFAFVLGLLSALQIHTGWVASPPDSLMSPDSILRSVVESLESQQPTVDESLSKAETNPHSELRNQTPRAEARSETQDNNAPLLQKTQIQRIRAEVRMKNSSRTHESGQVMRFDPKNVRVISSVAGVGEVADVPLTFNKEQAQLFHQWLVSDVGINSKFVKPKRGSITSFRLILVKVEGKNNFVPFGFWRGFENSGNVVLIDLSPHEFLSNLTSDAFFINHLVSIFGPAFFFMGIHNYYYSSQKPELLVEEKSQLIKFTILPHPSDVELFLKSSAKRRSEMRAHEKLQETFQHFNLGITDFDPNQFEIQLNSEGHINTTYVVTYKGKKFILQKVSSIFNHAAIEHNLILFEKAQDRAFESGLLKPPFQKLHFYDVSNPQEGKKLYKNEMGSWRVMDYVEGFSFKSLEEIPPAERSSVALQLGAHLSVFEKMLRLIDSDDRWQDSLPHFHDIDYHYQYLVDLMDGETVRLSLSNEEPPKRVHAVKLSALDSEIEARVRRLDRTFQGKYFEYLDYFSQQISTADKIVQHNDPKISNFVFSRGADGKLYVTLLYDLDTLQKGASFDDIADLLRTFGNVAGSEPASLNKVSINTEVVSSVIAGFLAERGFTPESTGVGLMIHDIIQRYKLFHLELGIRYLADFMIEGNENKYFKLKAGKRPDLSLFKAEVNERAYELISGVPREIEKLVLNKLEHKRNELRQSDQELKQPVTFGEAANYLSKGKADDRTVLDENFVTFFSVIVRDVITKLQLDSAGAQFILPEAGKERELAQRVKEILGKSYGFVLVSVQEALEEKPLASISEDFQMTRQGNVLVVDLAKLIVQPREELRSGETLVLKTYREFILPFALAASIERGAELVLLKRKLQGTSFKSELPQKQGPSAVEEVFGTRGHLEINFDVILNPSLVILNDPKGLLRGVKDLALRVNSAKDLTNSRSFSRPIQDSLRMTKGLADKSAAPHPPEDGFVLLAKNDMTIGMRSSTGNLILNGFLEDSIQKSPRTIYLILKRFQKTGRTLVTVGNANLRAEVVNALTKLWNTRDGLLPGEKNRTEFFALINAVQNSEKLLRIIQSSSTLEASQKIKTEFKNGNFVTFSQTGGLSEFLPEHGIHFVYGSQINPDDYEAFAPEIEKLVALASLPISQMQANELLKTVQSFVPDASGTGKTFLISSLERLILQGKAQESIHVSA